MTERERLVEELKTKSCSGDVICKGCRETISDFIIEDRKRIYKIFINDIENIPTAHTIIHQGVDLWKLIHKYEGLSGLEEDK